VKALFFTLLLAILAVEYFRSLPFERVVKRLMAVAQHSACVVIATRISDHWKERVLLCYARAIMTSTLSLALMLSGLLVLTTLGAFLLDRLFSPMPTTIEMLASPAGWFWMSVVAALYYYLTNRCVIASNGSEYSFGDKVLHRLALGNPRIGEISLEVDRAFCKNRAGKREKTSVFICGLARAGTTILMRTFYETGVFRSLTYRDMPFVLMPGLWKALSTAFHQHKAAKERAHGDGIEVNFDSPEAFEEVFWKTFAASDYLFQSHLSPHVANKAVLEQFRQFVDQVVASADQPEQQRYLSKNNNNILRLGSIRRAFPEALILVPFRDPVQQVISLLQQHTQFCALHEKDTFSRDYMGWLGHHEFGGTQRPFQFGERWCVTAKDHHPENINYWLALWINTYRYLLDTAPVHTVFVGFEELCSRPQEVIRMLFSKANLSISDGSLAANIRAPQLKQIDGIDPELKKQALETYHDLSEKAKEGLSGLLTERAL